MTRQELLNKAAVHYNATGKTKQMCISVETAYDLLIDERQDQIMRDFMAFSSISGSDESEFITARDMAIAQLNKLKGEDSS
jgi:hypothetical protein